MSDIRKRMEEFFPGDKELAVEMLAEIQKIGKSVDSLDSMLRRDLDVDARKFFVKALITSYAEIAASIITPIHYKFPELNNLKK